MFHFPISLFALAVLSSWQLQSCDGVEHEGLHRKLRPLHGGPPVNVHVGVYVESLGNIREATMDFSLTMYFRERWTDPLLAHNGTHETIYAGPDSSAIWSPDLFFLYEKAAKKHDVTVANVVVKVQPNGFVFKSSRISVTAACYMDLHRFPFDAQTCSLNVMSYSYSTNDITLIIGDDDVDIEPGLTISSFKLESIHTSNKDVPYSTAGNFSLAKVDFILQRQMQYFLLTVYIPSILLVIVAWISFFIDAEAAPARVSLGITAVLTITTMTAGIQESLPVVTYAKAIDIWLAACLVFVFVALIEYAIANYFLLQQKKWREARKRKLSDSEAEQPSKCATCSPSEDRMGQYKTQYYSVLKPTTTSAKGHDPEKQLRSDQDGIEPHWTADRVDRLAKYSYTILFVTFNAFYWPYYLVGR